MASNMMEKKNEHLADVTLHSLCTTLSKKFDGIKKDNKQLISEDLRDLSRLLFYGAKAESLHESFAINMLQFLRHVLSFSDVRCLQNGINFKNKLLILLSLKLMYISRQDSMILSDFKGKYFFQFLFHTALRTVNINANFVKNVVFQGISGFDKSSGIPKVSVLLLSPVLCCIESWDCECAGEISQKICQWLLLHWKQVASVPGKKSLFNARNLPMAPAITEIDGSTSRDIFTVLNVSQSYGTDFLLNVFSFSILKCWINFVNYQNDIAECLTNQLSKLMMSPEPRSYSGSPISIGGSKFYDDVSSGSDSAPSLSSSISSLHSFMYVDSLSNDQLEVKRITDSRPQTPFRKQSQAADTISITSDILSNASNLKNISIRYCLRVISQSERSPRRDSNRKIVTASVVESIEILDMLCTEDSGSMQKVFVEIKRLHQRIENNPFNARRVFVALLQFFIHHYEDMLLQIDDYLEIYFQGVSTFFSNQTAAFELLNLCLKNKEFFKEKTTALFKYFPNVLKVVAWWPVSFVEEACELIQIFVNKSNLSEVFHTILDLPCLTALLYLQQENILDDTAKLEELLGIPIKNYYQAMWSFVLRDVSGHADTIDKLSELHVTLKYLENNMRVKYTSDIVPSLLLSCFEAVDKLNDIGVLRNLFPIILERTFQIFPNTDYVYEIHELFSDEVQTITRSAPDILGTYHEETLTFISQAAACDTFLTSLITSVIWSVGESGAKSSCTSLQVNMLYNNIETFLLEVCNKIGKDDHFMSSSEVVSSLISTLSKLASYSQEWIPRAIMCLKKTSTSIYLNNAHSEFSYVAAYAKELVNVLQKPKVAPAIFCNEQKMLPWHKDADSSFLLKVHVLSRYTTDGV